MVGRGLVCVVCDLPNFLILKSGCKLSCVVEFLRWKLVNWVIL